MLTDKRPSVRFGSISVTDYRRPDSEQSSAGARLIGQASRIRRVTSSLQPDHLSQPLAQETAARKSWCWFQIDPSPESARSNRVGHRPPATGHRPPATGHRPPATGHRPPATAARRTSSTLAMGSALVSAIRLFWLAAVDAVHDGSFEPFQRSSSRSIVILPATVLRRRVG
jgi:hypothetical protein